MAMCGTRVGRGSCPALLAKGKPRLSQLGRSSAHPRSTGTVEKSVVVRDQNGFFQSADVTLLVATVSVGLARLAQTGPTTFKLPRLLSNPIIRRLFRLTPEQTADDWIDTNDLAFGSWSVVIRAGTVRRKFGTKLSQNRGTPQSAITWTTIKRLHLFRSVLSRAKRTSKRVSLVFKKWPFDDHHHLAMLNATWNRQTSVTFAFEISGEMTYPGCTSSISTWPPTVWQ